MLVLRNSFSISSHQNFNQRNSYSLNMFSEIKKILSLLLSVAFSSIGFIAAITVAALSVREVSTNPYFSYESYKKIQPQ